MVKLHIANIVNEKKKKLLNVTKVI